MKKREWYPGAIYHIMGRGNRRKSIFEDKIDYQYFLETSRYFRINPVKARMVDYLEDYLWSNYQSFIGMSAFVEDAKTYYTHEIDIQKSMGEDELWLPW